jgi:preprotein translocase subunit SecG
MSIFYGFLTFVLIVVCVLLIAFVLVQLPKKEAGAGMAFGGAATDALFGAGSGSAVTVITKWLAGIFFGLSFLMAILSSDHGQNAGSGLVNALGKSDAASHAITEPAAATTTGSNNAINIIPSATNAAKSTNAGLMTMPNAPTPATNNK